MKKRKTRKANELKVHFIRHQDKHKKKYQHTIICNIHVIWAYV